MNRGIVLILSGYLLWGLFPIYWALLNHVNPSEVLLHRVVWAMPILAVIVYLKSSWNTNFKESITSRKELLFLLLTATLITINWGAYIVAVNLGRVVEGSMGYFLAPVISMLGGYIFFHERISRLKQWSALFASVGALYYVFSSDSFPLLGFVLGVSFALYGLARKPMLHFFKVLLFFHAQVYGCHFTVNHTFLMILVARKTSAQRRFNTSKIIENGPMVKDIVVIQQKSQDPSSTIENHHRDS